MLEFFLGSNFFYVGWVLALIDNVGLAILIGHGEFYKVIVSRYGAKMGFLLVRKPPDRRIGFGPQNSG